MGFLHTGDMMAVYRNIGLYGFPVSYITVSIVVCVIAGALLLAATVLIFSEQKITSRAGHRILPKGKRQRKIRSYRLFYGETKKILHYQHMLLFVAGFAVLILWNYKPVTMLYNDDSDVYYKQYVDQVSGPYTKASAAKIREWQQERLEMDKKIHDEKHQSSSRRFGHGSSMDTPRNEIRRKDLCHCSVI
ncbi:hypothetical protein DXA20_01815 [Roseburia sp. AM59-24XD]|nr:hypothetical protein DXA20_01815 [Roseburia sp. AM59-24XD]